MTKARKKKIIFSTLAISAVVLSVVFAYLIRAHQSLDFKYLLDGDPYGTLSESISIIKTGQIQQDIHFYPPKGIYLPFLYSLLVSIWGLISGISLFNIYRFIGPIFSALAAALVYIAGVALFNKKSTALLAAVIYGGLLTLIQRGTIGVHENIIYLFTPLVIYFCARYLNERKILFISLASFLTTAGVLFHAAMLLLYCPVLLSICLMPGVRLRKRVFHFLVVCFIALVIIISAWPGLFWPILYQMGLGHIIYQPSAGEGVAPPISVPPPTLNFYASSLGIFLIIFAFLGILQRPKNRIYWVLLVYMLVILFFMDTLPRFLSLNRLPKRFLPYFSFPFLFFASYGLDKIVSRVHYRKIPVVFLAFSFIFLVPLKIPAWSEISLTGWEYKGLLWVKQNIPEDAVIFTQPIMVIKTASISEKRVAWEDVKQLFFSESSDELQKGVEYYFEKRGDVPGKVFFLISAYKLKSWCSSSYDGKKENSLCGMNEDLFSGFQRVFQNQDLSVFRVR